jgi:hypothetical protein
MIFTFACRDEDRTVVVEFDAVQLDEIQFTFNDFLRGCGFYIEEKEND